MHNSSLIQATSLNPHPGNLLRTYDGKLAYLSIFLMVFKFWYDGEFKQEFQHGFIEACLHLVNRDFDALGKDFVTLGLLPPTAQKGAVTEALTGTISNFRYPHTFLSSFGGNHAI
ncbi:hypothetical protein NE237_014272 [Protea cynaroides]|uniref:Uncharacterized protein n=1 Tax=Protea cynaroides TaxID=273540 RepID=A0A9Q0GL89_9MAGN|nr:hypothetical protein NE237_014272 [Protea cynaroides]